MRVWLSRLLIAAVLIWNVQCALAFLISPVPYAASFEVSGEPGRRYCGG